MLPGAGKLEDKVTVAVDALCALCLGAAAARAGEEPLLQKRAAPRPEHTRPHQATRSFRLSFSDQPRALLKPLTPLARRRASSHCAPGLQEGQAVPEQAAPLIRDLVAGAFPAAGPDAVAAAVASRPDRALAYK